VCKNDNKKYTNMHI